MRAALLSEDFPGTCAEHFSFRAFSYWMGRVIPCVVVRWSWWRFRPLGLLSAHDGCVGATVKEGQVVTVQFAFRCNLNPGVYFLNCGVTGDDGVQPRRHATPVRNLWMCGSGAHPGGGVMGSPGELAAKQLLREGGL